MTTYLLYGKNIIYRRAIILGIVFTGHMERGVIDVMALDGV